MKQYTDVIEKAKLVRKWCLIPTTEAGSGHPTSSLSAADIGTILFDKYFTYDLSDPKNLLNDRLVFSKGHASPLYYSLYGVAGAVPLEELKMLRKFGSILEGHPTPVFPHTDASTGSLGQGLSVGAGLAYAVRDIAKKAKAKRVPKAYVLLGDGELAEGQVWEAANFASYYSLDNLIAIADINRLGQSQATMFGHHMDEYERRFEAFGFKTIVVDGHDFADLDSAFAESVANKSGEPVAIIAKTLKGKGISFLEDQDNWHGKAMKKEDLERALSELGDVDDSLRFVLQKPDQYKEKPTKKKKPSLPTFDASKEIATREVYGEVLAELGSAEQNIYALDAEVKNSTFSQTFLKSHPDRFIECFIAEQNMVGVALGMQRLGINPFVSTFASFLTRAYDQIRMAAISRGNIKFVGSHSGVSIGEDGPSQMGLEDIAMFGPIPNSVILHPSDAVSTAKLLHELVDHHGISYFRTLRPATPVLYSSKDIFSIGGSQVLKSSKSDVLAIAAAGITVHEALKAYAILKEKGVFVRIIDCFSIKPIDKKTLVKSVKETKKNVIISVEDHFYHGGLGDHVLDAVSNTGAIVHKLAVKKISRSGKKDELLKDSEIDADSIIAAVLSYAK